MNPYNCISKYHDKKHDLRTKIKSYLPEVSIIGLLILSFSGLNCNNKRASERPPNFVIVLADDLGYDDLGINNSIFRTPHIDQMSAESVVFNSFYVNPICAPSRASLLTGRHYLRTGVSHVHAGKDFIHLGETLVSNILSDSGYSCGYWGKWHSGHTSGYFPWERGFHEAYFAELYKHDKSRGYFNGSFVSHEKWADEVIVNYAIDFIERNQDQPFLAFISSLTPHLPIAAPMAFKEPYIQQGYSDSFAGLLGMVEHLDNQLGRLFAKIDELNLSDHTVIIFLSDNGPQIMSGLITKEERDLRYASKMKGHKGDLWENGVKSPLFVKFPAQYAPKTIQSLADITDILPTLLEISGINIPDTLRLDGHSLVPLIKGIEVPDRDKWRFDYTHQAWVPDDEIPYTLEGRLLEYNPSEKKSLFYEDQLLSTHHLHYKCIQNPNLTPFGRSIHVKQALFDLKNDPVESKEIGSKHVSVMDQMESQMNRWWKSIIHEPHSFAAPVFQIGKKSLGKSDEILTHSPSQITGDLVCTVRDIRNWRMNHSASYRIRVLHEGNYKISMHLNPVNVREGTCVSIHTNHDKTSTTLDGTEWQTLNTLYLTKQDTSLVLTVNNNSINNPSEILLHSVMKLRFETEK